MKLIPSLLGALLASVAKADTFIIAANMNLMSRMDPIVNPGRVGNHVHSFSGASNVREVLNTPAEQDRAACTSVNVGADKSNYWAPTLYYIHDNGTYTPMDAAIRVYYRVFKPDTQPFPKGMRMVTGTAMSRDKSDPRTMGIMLGCNGNSQPLLPNKHWKWNTCGTSNTIEISATFPSCGWANQSLDSADHFSHMAWPLDTLHGMGPNPGGPGGTSCPESHPIAYPSIMHVSFYNLGDDWKAGRDNVVLSNGDLDGGSYHADFISGWDEGVLSDAINHASDSCNVGPDVESCPPFKPTFQGDINEFVDNRQCVYQGQVPNEDIGLHYPISKLPGCNPLWPPEMAEKPTCNEQANPGWVSPNVWKSGNAPNFPFVMHDPMPGLYNRLDPAFFKRPRFGPWGSLGRNNDTIMLPEGGMVDGWLGSDSTESSFNQIKGIQDDSAWQGILPGDKAGSAQEPALPVGESSNTKDASSSNPTPDTPTPELAALVAPAVTETPSSDVTATPVNAISPDSTSPSATPGNTASNSQPPPAPPKCRRKTKHSRSRRA